MTLVDDRILEYINENEFGSATKMKEDAKIRYTSTHIAERCRELVKHGLLRPAGNGVYVITDVGKRYLEGELDTGEFDEGNGERRASA